ncbi:MAG TPA: hypothetical protein VHC69_18705 [Polyangiaceae bacterium]|nr:hypothetical protein [Polyangiaceae bacterium]
MPRSPLTPIARLHVAIVSKNPETLGALAEYLQGAGATTRGTHQIDGAAKVSAGASAVVVFPDDFTWSAVLPALRACSRTHPDILILIVTSAPQRFEALVWPEASTTPLTVPKPAWGWTILDAIRAHLDDSSAAGGNEP